MSSDEPILPIDIFGYSTRFFQFWSSLEKQRTQKTARTTITQDDWNNAG